MRSNHITKKGIAMYRLTIVFGCLIASAVSVAADNFPTHPVRLVVGFAPGGGADNAARNVAQKLNEAWSQSIIVAKRAGAGGNVAADIVAPIRGAGHIGVHAARERRRVGFVRHIADDAAHGAAPEERALRPLEYLDALEIELLVERVLALSAQPPPSPPPVARLERPLVPRPLVPPRR